jgi:hypothetical protein
MAWTRRPSGTPLTDGEPRPAPRLGPARRSRRRSEWTSAGHAEGEAADAPFLQEQNSTASASHTTLAEEGGLTVCTSRGYTLGGRCQPASDPP